MKFMGKNKLRERDRVRVKQEFIKIFSVIINSFDEDPKNYTTGSAVGQ